jgi:hypothetical protein
MEYLKTFLGGAGGAAIVAGLFALIQWRLNRKAQKEDKAADREQAENEGMKEILKKMDVLFLADRTILFDRIKHLGKSYIDRGYITVEELEDLKLMHQVYHDPDKLNGNGFLDALMDTVTHSLEIRAK